MADPESLFVIYVCVPRFVELTKVILSILRTIVSLSCSNRETELEQLQIHSTPAKMKTASWNSNNQLLY